MPDETSPLPISLEDLASRLTALEVASQNHTDALHESAIEIGETLQQLKSMISANARVSQAVVVPAAAGGVARTTSPAERKDAWGKPLDASGKVVALPAKPTGDVPACCGHVHQGACATTCPICSGKQS